MDPRPQRMPWLTPYLTVADADAALAFYERAFGFVPGEKHVEDGRTQHGGMSYRDQVVVMFAPEGAFGGTCKTPAHSKVEPAVSFYVYVDDVDGLHARAVAAGARSVVAPEDMFWGDRYCQLEDPDGHLWGFARHLGER